MLTIYFTLAVGAHLPARDLGLNAVSASTLLATYGALATKASARPNTPTTVTRWRSSSIL
jgi:hypothetical protein